MTYKKTGKQETYEWILGILGQLVRLEKECLADAGTFGRLVDAVDKAGIWNLSEADVRDLVAKALRVKRGEARR